MVTPLTSILGPLLVESISNGEIDLAIVSYPRNSEERPEFSTTVDGLEMVPLTTEGFFLVGAEEDTALPDPCELSDLGDRRFLALDSRRELPHWSLEAIAAENGVALNVVVEAQNLAILKDLVVRGFGVSVMPFSSVYREVTDGRMHARRVKHLWLERVLAYKSGAAAVPEVATLARLIREEVARLEAEGALGPVVDAAIP